MLTHKTTLGSLFLQGVFKKDCPRIEDLFQVKLLDTFSQTKSISDIKYDKIPTKFTSVKDWPKTTNLECWFCRRTHKNRPYFEPQSIDPSNDQSDGKTTTLVKEKNGDPRKIMMITKGTFCSRNCTRAYINLHTPDMVARMDKIKMLIYLDELFTGTALPDIQPSPSPNELLRCGGNLTDTEYQQKIDCLDMFFIKELNDNNFNMLVRG